MVLVVVGRTFLNKSLLIWPSRCLSDSRVHPEESGFGVVVVVQFEERKIK